jgi:hypothetical protein
MFITERFPFPLSYFYEANAMIRLLTVLLLLLRYLRGVIALRSSPS